MRAARFHRTVLRLLSAPFLIGARSHLLNTVVVRTRPQTERATDSATIVAATVLCAWSHHVGPGPVHSEAAFAILAGVAPIPANSGQVTTRYRLNRYGDRHLNTALHTVVQIRIQYQPATRDYVARRTAEGKTSREIKRCLARYVAHDPYRLLESGAASGSTKRQERRTFDMRAHRGLRGRRWCCVGEFRMSPRSGECSPKCGVSRGGDVGA